MYRYLEGIELTLWRDHDSQLLQKLSYEGKLKWFELRTNHVLFNPVRQLLELEHRKTADKDFSFVLIIGNAIFGAIEALGSFYLGREGNRASFVAFVESYMDKALLSHVDVLRDDFRNGIAHGFTVKQGGFEFNPTNWIRIDIVRGLELDPDILYCSPLRHEPR